MTDTTSDEFFKSSFSQRSARCVEVSIRRDKVVVRNSRDTDPRIEFTIDEWNAFVAGVKANEFDIR